MVLSIDIVNTRRETITFKKSEIFSPRFSITFYNGKKFLAVQYLAYLDTTIAPADTLNTTANFVVPEELGNYSCQLSIVNNNLPPGFNSKPFKLKVEK